jgi:hypothetical protein
MRKVGKECEVKTIKDLVSSYGPSYVGPSAVAFLHYLENIELVTINDILENYEKASKNLKNLNRDILSSLLNNLKEKDCESLTVKQFNNCVKFLKSLSEDEVMAYIHHVLAKDLKAKISKTGNMAKLLTVHFPELKEKIISLLK